MKHSYAKIITIVLLLIGKSLFAQEQGTILKDTLYMKSGNVIPCNISSIDAETNLITIQLLDTNGIMVYEPMELDQIQTYSISNTPQFETDTSQYKIDLIDGTRLIGKVLLQNDSIVILEIPDLGELRIRRENIDKMIQVNAPLSLRKSLWFTNPNATRLFFAPTAIPLRQGEGYYQNIYIIGNMFNVGLLNNLSIGGGFDFISMFGRFGDEWNPILNFNVKTGFKVHEYVHVGVGGLYVTQIGEFSAGITYALGTFGSYNSNFTAGLGWGFVDGTFEQKPFIMFGGMVRCSEKVWFVSENWLAPLDTDEKYYLAVSYGVRFSGKKISVDLGFINSKDIVEGIFIGIPYVDFVVKFGK